MVLLCVSLMTHTKHSLQVTEWVGVFHHQQTILWDTHKVSYNLNHSDTIYLEMA